MNPRTNYILVGLFVLVLSVASIAGILWLGAGGPIRPYDAYLVYTGESVAGLRRDSAVKYHGVDVGRVGELGLDPRDSARVRLLLQIDKGTPIHKDTVAVLATHGLTGLTYVNLTGGSQDSPPLRAHPGEAHPVIETRPSTWGRLERSLGELVDNLIDTSKRLQRVLGDDNQRHLSDTLAQLDSLTGTLAGRAQSMASSLEDLEAAMQGLRTTSARLPQLVQHLDRTAGALERMADQIAAAGTAIRGAVEARNRDLQTFTAETFPEAAAMIRELRQAAENFRRFSEALQRNPGVLLRGAAGVATGPGE